MRDVIRKIARKVIEQERPRYRYATIVSVDTVNRKAQVMYPEDDDPVWVPYGIIAVPTGAGQIVRIEGLDGDRFIADVLTPFT